MRGGMRVSPGRMAVCSGVPVGFGSPVSYGAGTGLRVAHPLVREAIIATTPALERSTLHGLIADACEKAGLGSAVASHRLDAFEGVRTRETAAAAARAGLAAALEARSVHANAAAANLFKRSLAALEACGSDVRAELRAWELEARLALGEILAESGRLEAAVAQFDAALPLARGDPSVPGHLRRRPPTA